MGIGPIDFISIILSLALFISGVRSDHNGNCRAISKQKTFFRLNKLESQSPKGESVNFLEDFKRGGKQIAPFKYYITWEKLYENASSTLRSFVQKGLEKTESLFGEILQGLKEGKRKMAVGKDLSVFDQGRKVLLNAWPHLRRQPPEDLSQAIACYGLSYYPFVAVIRPVDRPIERRALGYGVRAKIDIRPFTILVGYQGLEYDRRYLSDYWKVRIREMNSDSSNADYTLSVDGYPDYLIEGAPAVAIHHRKRITLIDKKTNVSFALGALVNGAKKRNVEWSQYEIDGQPLVIFFSTRWIRQGEELFVYYGDEYMASMVDPIY